MAVKPYIQNNIPYFFVAYKEEDKAGYHQFIYSWQQVQSGHKGHTHIYCRSMEDLVGLINYWNRQEHWKYWIDPAYKENQYGT